jgi:hypothetical protein
MPFNIDTFRNQISNRGYLTTNKFEVILTPPKIMLNGFLASLMNLGNTISVLNVMGQIKYRVDQIRAPGVSIVSADIQRYGVGTTQKMPINASMGEITLSILSDGYGDIWQFWYNWVRGIYQFNGTTSSLFGISTGTATYTAEYKDNFSTTMELIIYDPYGVPTMKIDLFEAFPTAIREIPLAWSDTGNLMHLNIGISFTDFTIVGANFASPYTISGAVNDFGSLLNGSLFNNSTGGTLGNILNITPRVGDSNPNLQAPNPGAAAPATVDRIAI